MGSSDSLRHYPLLLLSTLALILVSSSAKTLLSGNRGEPELTQIFRRVLKGEPSWIVRDKACNDAYVSAMTALIEEGRGTDLVLGANDGKRFDPATEMFDYWSKVPLHNKVFVEPVPPLFARLQDNTANLENVLLVNKAISLGTQGTAERSSLALFCWNMDTIDKAVKNGTAVLPPEVRQPQDYWTALCSKDKHSVISHSNVFDTDAFKALPPSKQEEVRAQVDQHVILYNVESFTPAEIIKEQGLRDMKYVQIDVEGMDNEIVQALPLGVDDFLPKVIMYEHSGGDSLLVPFLEDHGYEWCCCIQHKGSNALALLK